MKILKTSQVKEADLYTIENEPIESIDLMERAATRASEYIKKLFKDKLKKLCIKVFAGPGNNGGDGLVIARKLYNIAKCVEIFIVQYREKYSTDFNMNLKRLKALKIPIYTIKQINQFPQINKNDIIIDAIFGSGLNKPVYGLAAEVINKINKLTNTIIAVDIPSGLFGEKIQNNDEPAIMADYTLTFEFPFLSFFFKENNKYVGDFIIIPIGISKEYIAKANTKYFLIEPTELKIKKIKKFSHKGDNGRGLLIAGSYGRTGAAVLSALGALRSGIGLLTIACTTKNLNIIQTSVPEALTFISSNDDYIKNLPDNINNFDAIAIGPAIGITPKPKYNPKDTIWNTNSTNKFYSDTEKIIDKVFKLNKPTVIDADAITVLSENKFWYDNLPQNSILTPHVGEFERLVGKTHSHLEQIEKQKEFAQKYNIIIILKQAHTTVALPDGRIFFNITGNPGLATGGSGDVLTGILLSLLAQGYSPHQAALIGVYIHGLAADITLEQQHNKYGYEAITPSEITKNLGKAFTHIREKMTPKFIFTQQDD